MFKYTYKYIAVRRLFNSHFISRYIVKINYYQIEFHNYNYVLYTISTEVGSSRNKHGRFNIYKRLYIFKNKRSFKRGRIHSSYL